MLENLALIYVTVAMTAFSGLLLYAVSEPCENTKKNNCK